MIAVSEPHYRKGNGNMKDYSTIMEAIERKIEGIEPGQAVKLDEITGGRKEKEIIAGTKMLLKKYGIQYQK